MAVYAERHADAFGDLARRARHPFGEAAAVRVAQHDARGAALGRRPQRRQRVDGVGPVAVEEVFGVVNQTGHARGEVADGVGDDLKILLVTQAQGLGHVQPPGLPEDCDDRSLRTQQRLDARVIIARKILPPRRAEGRQARVAQLERAGALEEFHVARVRAGPAALDEVHAERVEVLADAALVLDREVDPLALRAVAQRRVVDFDPFAHGSLNAKKPFQNRIPPKDIGERTRITLMLRMRTD